MKFSIITVTYNAGKTLVTTLESIINQTYNDYEIIIIDGGSKDETLNIIQQYNKYISYFVSEKDNGIYDAMNKGIKVSCGEYCIFLNAGDAFHCNTVLSKVTLLLDHNKENECAMFLGYADYVKGNKIKTVFPNITKLPYTFCHQAMFFKTNIIKKNPYNTNYKLSGDSELLYRLLTLGKDIKLLDIKVVLEQSGDGATYNNLWASCKELYNLSYIRKRTTVIYRVYRLFKIIVYLSLRKMKIID